MGVSLRGGDRRTVSRLGWTSIVTAGLVLAATSASAAVTPEQLCVEGKLKQAGKHAKKLAKKCYAKDARNPGTLSVPACVNGENVKVDQKFGRVALKTLSKGGKCLADAEDLDLHGATPWLDTVLAELFQPTTTYPNLCASKKIGAVGLYADKLAKCYAKDYKKPDPGKFVACVAKADAKLVKDWAKADLVGPCASDTDEETMTEVRRQVRLWFDILRFGDGQIIENPENGLFTNASSVAVDGLLNGAEPLTLLEVNGTDVLPLDVNNRYATTASLDPGLVFNPIVAELQTAAGVTKRDRVTLVVGNGTTTGFVPDDGTLSSESLAMRFTDTGLAQIQPIVGDLAGGAFDINSLLTAQNPVLDDECVVEALGLCLYWATVNVVSVDYTTFDLDLDALASGTTDVGVGINDFVVDISLDVRDAVAVNFNCGLEISADAANIDGTYDMVPDSGNPSKVDVNQIGGIDVALPGFSHEFTSGLCDAPIIGDIIDSFVGPTIQNLVEDGFETNLVDPDGAGPLDSPIADGVEGALDGIDIAGPVGQTIGVVLDAEFSSITEDANGIDFAVNSAISSLGVAPGAPDLTASYSVAEAFPSFPATSPILGQPYGMALGISTTAFNQLLKAQIEDGLLQSEITEFALGGPPLPLTVGLLKAFIPELDGEFDDTEAMVVELRPQLAPIVTGAAGPSGELAEMRMSHLIANVKVVSADFTVLQIAVDVKLGIDLAVLPSGLSFTIALPLPGDTTIDILENPLNSNEVVIQAFLSSFLPLAFPDLASALGDFPLPSFLGLELDPVEVSRAGQFMTIYANLTLGP